MDELRAAGQLNPESAWIQTCHGIHDDRACYCRSNPSAQAERARDAVRHKHLSQSCLNELRKDRPASPPIPAEKRDQGRVRVRFYNNTPDDVDLYFMKQGFPKKMFDIRSGNKSGSFAMVGSKFHAESAAGKKYGPWVRASPPSQHPFLSCPRDAI